MQITQIGFFFGALLLVLFFVCIDWNERRTAETTGKSERPESLTDRKVRTRTTGNPERPESQKDRKTETTAMLEQVIRACIRIGSGFNLVLSRSRQANLTKIRK
jgi:hypothetical protein